MPGSVIRPKTMSGQPSDSNRVLILLTKKIFLPFLHCIIFNVYMITQDILVLSSFATDEVLFIEFSPCTGYLN
jgi:hypothetical protein